jgi:hypothetical protein
MLQRSLSDWFGRHFVTFDARLHDASLFHEDQIDNAIDSI